MKTIGSLLLLLLASALILTPSTSKADEVLQVSGEMLGTGNPVCASSPCTEVIDFSFQVLQPVLVPFQGWSPSFASMQFSGSGPLGDFAFGGGDHFSVSNTINGSIYLLNSVGDELDMLYKLSSITSTGFDFTLDPAFFYSCQSAACLADFSPSGTPCINMSCNMPPMTFEHLNVAQVPEPSAAYMVAIGLFSVSAFCAVRRFQRSKHLYPFR